jgi:hypothetical protein
MTVRMRERDWQQVRLDTIRRQVADGELVIRKMTPAERERYGVAPAAVDPRPSRPTRRVV